MRGSLPVKVMLCDLGGLEKGLEGYTVAYTLPSPVFGPEWIVYRGYFAICTPASNLSKSLKDGEIEAIREPVMYAVEHALGNPDPRLPWVSEMGGQAWDIASRMGWPVFPINTTTPVAVTRDYLSAIDRILPREWEDMDRVHRKQKMLVALTRSEMRGEIMRFPEFIMDSPESMNKALEHASRLMGENGVLITTPNRLEAVVWPGDCRTGGKNEHAVHVQSF